ncbi:hypothetical protein [Ostreibacterium oceani]|uniref:Uncharacterized protein n=1 Tax=Ostreibacterium oceani TaxID=2654998 RepID=A0A6N7EZ76_9GAMM|nr:hypothetical protein [Ostreibacterium oceani]MPV86835.1 hypothetical protein [Ostreibacterium oceani]
MKPWVIFFILACIAVGVYAWKQRQQAFDDLKQLAESGVETSLRVESRPIMVLDKSRAMLYLVGLGKIEEIPFANITEIKFVETPETGNNASLPRGPDSALITTKSAVFRVTDLPRSAEETLAFFAEQALFDGQLTLQSRR